MGAWTNATPTQAERVDEQRPDAVTLIGLPPVVDRATRVLVLGSMPGAVSLRLEQYYANPRNAFWRIMGDVLEVKLSAEYARRLAALRDAGIGLWDVARSCARDGSLDSSIVQTSVVPNDFGALFRSCPDIDRVFFNGATAEQIFMRRAKPVVNDRCIAYRRLPSTSPAHAAVPYADKLARWRAAFGVLCR